MKKHFVLLAMLCIALLSFAQPSVIIDDKFEKVNRNKMATFYTMAPLSEEVYIYKDGNRRVSEIWHLSEQGKEVTTLQVPRGFEYVNGCEIYGKTLGVYKKIDLKKGTTEIYFNQVDKKAGVAKWDPKFIKEVPSDNIAIKFAVSPDHELFGLSFCLRDKFGQTIGWEMLTCTAKGFIFWNKQIETKFKGDTYNVQNFSVDDEGQISMLTISYTHSRKLAEDMELSLTIADEYGINTYSTPVQKHEIWSAEMLKLSNGQVFVAGYYTNDRKGKEAGLATTFFNPTKKIFTKVRFTEFRLEKAKAKAKIKAKKDKEKAKAKAKKEAAKAKRDMKRAKNQGKAVAKVPRPKVDRKKMKSEAKENIKEPKEEDYRYIMTDMFERPNGSIAIFGEERAIETEKSNKKVLTNLFTKYIIFHSVTAKGAVSEYSINKNQVGIGDESETNHRMGGVSFYVCTKGNDIWLLYNDLKTNEPNNPEEIYQQQGFVDGNLVLCVINEKNKMAFKRIDGVDDDTAAYNIIQFKNGIAYTVKKTRSTYYCSRLVIQPIQ